jgi:hypothetical protein
MARQRRIALTSGCRGEGAFAHGPKARDAPIASDRARAALPSGSQGCGRGSNQYCALGNAMPVSIAAIDRLREANPKRS